MIKVTEPEGRISRGQKVGFNFIVDQNINCMCVTETWEKHNNFLHLNQTTPSGYAFICKPFCFYLVIAISDQSNHLLKSWLYNIKVQLPLLLL